MSDNNCKHCFIPNRKLKISDYFNTLSKWSKYVDTGIFKLIVGDCPLTDLEKHISSEKKYIYYHYFKCKCGKFCRSGICIRSTIPILEKMDEIPNDLISKYKLKEDIIIGDDYL